MRWMPSPCGAIAALGLCFGLVAACGARTDLGGHVATAPDASQEHGACTYCGGESTGESCTLWAYCPGEVDGSTILCNDAPHQLDCSCAAASCTCSSGKTVALTACPCEGLNLGSPEIIDPLVAACAF